ncbi:hypothetical protein RRSWK_04387 [Rhodopirellula sp. SWK7]|nr:hypothetical protein RRSWK_04387 [Rhodopirellula sp. SWK7]
MALLFGLMAVVTGCSDTKPFNVAEDADADAIAEYNRLNQEGIETMNDDDTNFNAE